MTNLFKDMFTGYSATETGNWDVTGTATWTTPSQVTIAGTTGIIANTSDALSDLTNTTHEIVFQSNAASTAVVLKYEVYDGANGLIVILNYNGTMSINGVASSASAYNFTADTDIKVRVIIDNNNVVKVYVDDMPTASQEGGLNADTTTATINFSSTTTSVNSVIKSLHMVDQVVDLPDFVNNYTHYFSINDVREMGFFRHTTNVTGEYAEDSSTVLTNVTDKLEINHIYSVNKYTNTTSTTLKQVPSSPSTGEFSFFPPNKFKLGDTTTSSDRYVIQYDIEVTNSRINEVREKKIQPMLDAHFGSMTDVPFGADSIPDQVTELGVNLCGTLIKVLANPESEAYRNAFDYWRNRLEDTNILTVDGVVQELGHPQRITNTPWQEGTDTIRRNRQNAWRG